MNEDKKRLIGYLVYILAVGVCCYMFGRALVSDNGAGADTVRKQLAEAGSHQQQFTEGIKEAQSGATELQRTISWAEQQIDGVIEGEREAGTIIADCQQILRGVRQRGKGEAGKN